MAVARTRSTAQATAEGLRVFVAGVSWNISEEVLHKDFSECGVIEDLFLIKDAEGNSKGRCFITFRDKEAVDAALEYNNTDYGGRKIYVKVAEAKRDTPSDRSQSLGKKPDGCVSLCLKRIGDASEEAVKGFLSGCSVEAVRLLTDRETGARRGVAFVDFSTTEDVDKAMKLNKQKLDGNIVEMDYVLPKPGASAPKQDKVAAVYPTDRPEGCTALCLKNLGDAVEDEIWEFLDGCEVQSIRIVYDRVSGASRGIAFADFSSTTGVDKAMERNGKKLKGKRVEMRYEAPKTRPRPDGCFTVAVKKLPAGALEPDVRKLFKGLNSLSDVRVICDKMMACTGLAFAEFTEPADVEAAVKRDGMSVLGQTVFICYETKTKKERESPLLKPSDEPAVKKKKRKRDGNPESAAPVENVAAPVAKEKSAHQASVENEGIALAESTTRKKKAKRKENEKRQVAEKERKKLRKKQKRSAAAAENAESQPPPADEVDSAVKLKKKKKKPVVLGESSAAMVAGDDSVKVKKAKKRKAASE